MPGARLRPNTDRSRPAVGRALAPTGGWGYFNGARGPAVVAALEAAGIEFTNGEQPGVRLRKGRG
jgi:hypothetical protein